MRFNVPGRVIGFYQGGGAYADYIGALRRNEPPRTTRDLGADELALFTAVDAGRRVSPSKGGYYVIAELSSEAVEALRYWAGVLETASADDAPYEPDSRNDLRTAQRTLEKLRHV